MLHEIYYQQAAQFTGTSPRATLTTGCFPTWALSKWNPVCCERFALGLFDHLLINPCTIKKILRSAGAPLRITEGRCFCHSESRNDRRKNLPLRSDRKRIGIGQLKFVIWNLLFGIWDFLVSFAFPSPFAVLLLQPSLKITLKIFKFF